VGVIGSVVVSHFLDILNDLLQLLHHAVCELSNVKRTCPHFILMWREPGIPSFFDTAGEMYPGCWDGDLPCWDGDLPCWDGEVPCWDGEVPCWDGEVPRSTGVRAPLLLSQSDIVCLYWMLFLM
jgi:hypothetical protein